MSNSTAEQPRKRRGRRPATPEQRAAWKPQRSIRLDDDRWSKLRQLGTEWLERAIDRARVG